MISKKSYLFVVCTFIVYIICYKFNFRNNSVNHSLEIKTWWEISTMHEDVVKVQRRSSTDMPTEKWVKRPKITRKATRFGNFIEQIEYFKLYWILQRDMRTNYEKIKAPCRRSLKWHSYYADRTAYRISSANNSIITLDIQPAGQYSRILIESYSLLNTEKDEGGDSWRIHIYGVTSVPVTLVDNQDGSYEASFLIIEPGSYYAEIYLDYTLCDGFKDPPHDWFVKGNTQGKHQPANTLPNYERPFLIERFGDVYFDIEDAELSIYKVLERELSDIYPKHPCFLWDGFGRWLGNKEWLPYISEPFIEKSSVKRQTGNGLFWIYGDSMGDLFYKANLKKPLCMTSFRECNRTYNWVYNLQHGNITWASQEQDDKDFSVNRIVSELNEVLQSESLDENSVLFLNYGLHYAQEIPFATFVQMIDRVIGLIKHEREAGRFRAQLVWKTSTAIQKWKWGDPKTNARHSIGNRFLTSSRVELFNTFSTSKLCDAGIKILEVHPMTYAYPNGTGTRAKPWDAVHYDSKVFKAVEDFLINYFDNDSSVT